MAVDKRTAERLVCDYGGRLYAFCLRITQNKTNADDLYQQTFLKILDMTAELDWNDNPASFLMAVAARVWKDEQRKFARRNRILPPAQDDQDIAAAPDDTSVAEQMEQKQHRADVQRAMRQLSDTLRAPVLLYYMAELSIQEIAKTLHIPQGTVKSRLNQAKKKLKVELERVGYGT